uniref:Peptidase M14 domain-containing protein n=1 Tax=Scylla olivacea TaxID=85551 RepID=A0A0P4W9B3_SCYOL
MYSFLTFSSLIGPREHSHLLLCPPLDMPRPPHSRLSPGLRACRGDTQHPYLPQTEIGASDNPCSDIYAGPEPFSEVEMRVVRDQLTSIADIKVYLSLHSFSQLWMYPWGFTSSLPHDWRDLVS